MISSSSALCFTSTVYVRNPETSMHAELPEGCDNGAQRQESWAATWFDRGAETGDQVSREQLFRHVLQ